VIEAHRGFRLKDQKQPKNKSKGMPSQTSITAMQGGGTDAIESLKISSLNNLLKVSRMKHSLDIEFSCAFPRERRDPRVRRNFLLVPKRRER
jgi:hypothetical protein